MFVRLGKLLIVTALVAMLGAHWALLQTVAWTTMLADNLQSASLQDAIVKTFDGRHPCPLCRAIAAGKKAEQKREFTAQMQRFEFPPPKESLALIPPSEFRLLPLMNSFAERDNSAPPTPPPRTCFV